MTHTWEIETIDGGDLFGLNDFWICRECGASGGPTWDSRPPPTFTPFLAGHVLDIGTLTCEDVKAAIQAHLAASPTTCGGCMEDKRQRSKPCKAE